MPPPRAPSPAAPALSVLLVNVQTENPRHDLVIAEVRRLRPDVVVFEEVDAAWSTDLSRALAAGPGPSIEATVVAHGRAVALVATHPVPAMDAEGMRLRDARLASLARHIPRGVATAVIGDLDATPWSRPLRDLRRSTGLVDSLAGRGVQPSWPAALPWIARLPIDHVLPSAHLATAERALGRDVGSDHRPVYARLVFR
jgi:endonuclease/exonuclease/phosphatase (EEP) superfamily protein YafD